MTPQGEPGSSFPSPAVPVWAPNPAVPLPARILAYLFGGMTLLAVLLGLVIPRSPDTPPDPSHWLSYHSPNGCSLPYPADWDINSTNKDGTDSVFLTLMPGSPVQAYAMIRQCPQDITDTMLQNTAHGLVTELSNTRTFHNFSEREQENISDAADVERSFTFTGNDMQKSKLAGAITLHAAGRTLLILIAIAPVEGWASMKRIAGYMVENAKFE